MGLHTGECERTGEATTSVLLSTGRRGPIHRLWRPGGAFPFNCRSGREHLPPGMQLVDLGSHRLKDIERPEEVSQLTMEGVPRSSRPFARRTTAYQLTRPKRVAHREIQMVGPRLLGIGVVALVVAAAVFAVSRPSAGSHTTHAVADSRPPHPAQCSQPLISVPHGRSHHLHSCQDRTHFKGYRARRSRIRHRHRQPSSRSGSMGVRPAAWTP